MRNMTFLTALMLIVSGLSGCAGGWRNGAPQGAAVTSASPSAMGATTGATAASAGMTFVWKGDGASVNIAGDFNEWSTSADQLTKQADGSWTITKTLAPGRYAYKFVIDGGTWKEDPNAKETVDDGYGGKNAIAVVGAASAAAAAPTSAKPKAGAPTVIAAAGKAPEFAADGVRFFFGGAHQSVHLAGDFNGWSTTSDPLALGADGVWTLLKKLDSGTYGYKFVVDGTTWKQDEANPDSIDDGFGGKNSVITVK